MLLKIVKRTADRGPVAAAMTFLTDALQKKGISQERLVCWEGALQVGLLFAGTLQEEEIRRLDTGCSHAPESFVLTVRGGALVAAGSDERGLAYALLELGERVLDRGEAALTALTETKESPRLRVRGVDRFVMNSGDESWWQNEGYWRDFLFDRLRDRFNRLTLIVGFDTAYLSPPYAFFVDVPEFPQVRPADYLKVDKAAYLAALRRLGQLAHEYGMEFSFAIWQQIPWQSGQQRVVEGLDNTDLLCRYCQEGVKTLLLQCPEIDVLHFRVNHESGVGTQISAEEYWLRQIEAVAEAKDQGRDVELELRAKGMTDPMVSHAKQLGLSVTVSTKYYCEHAGLPHHLTRMRSEEMARLWNFNATRRYSYGDMLRKPRLNSFLYRIWNDGSTDLFTWGDADYVQRFMASMDVGPADGFEVMPPLSMKGGHEYEKVTDWTLFRDPAYQPERWEDDRYWLFYRLFGRLGYARDDADAELWMRPAREHFGPGAEPMVRALGWASRLMPLVVGYHFPQHPQLRYWPEMSSGAALFAEHNHTPFFKNDGNTYQNSLPSDEGLFYSVEQYVKAQAEGTLDGRYTPYQVAGWLLELREQAAAALEEAKAAGLPDNAELRGAVLDVELLCAFADYHRHKLMAALGLSRYQLLGDRTTLQPAVEEMEAALAAWKLLSDRGGETYAEDLVFAAGENCPRKGTWAQFLPELTADLEALKALRDAEGEGGAALCRPVNTAPVDWQVDLPDCWSVGKDLPVTVLSAETAPRMRVRRTNHLEGEFRVYEMVPCDGGYTAVIPGEEFDPAWDTLVYFDSVDAQGDAAQWPGLYHPAEKLPYKLICVK